MEEPTQQEKIRVCLRLRPQNKLEEARRSKNCVSVDGKANGNGAGGKRILVNSPLEGEFDFEFDEVRCHVMFIFISIILGGFSMWTALQTGCSTTGINRAF